MWSTRYQFQHGFRSHQRLRNADTNHCIVSASSINGALPSGTNCSRIQPHSPNQRSAHHHLVSGLFLEHPTISASETVVFSFHRLPFFRFIPLLLFRNPRRKAYNFFILFDHLCPDLRLENVNTHSGGMPLLAQHLGDLSKSACVYSFSGVFCMQDITKTLGGKVIPSISRSPFTSWVTSFNLKKVWFEPWHSVACNLSSDRRI